MVFHLQASHWKFKLQVLTANAHLQPAKAMQLPSNRANIPTVSIPAYLLHNLPQSNPSQLNLPSDPGRQSSLECLGPGPSSPHPNCSAFLQQTATEAPSLSSHSGKVAEALLVHQPLFRVLPSHFPLAGQFICLLVTGNPLPNRQYRARWCA